MVFHDIAPCFEKRIRVVLDDGQVFAGLLFGFEDELDSNSGMDQIELDVGDIFPGMGGEV